MNLLKWLFAFSISLIVLFILSGIFVVAVESSYGRHKILSLFTSGLSDSGWNIQFKESELTLPDKIALRGVSLTSPQGDTAAIDSIDAQISLLRLLRREIAFTQFSADHIRWSMAPRDQSIAQPSLNKTAPTGIPFALRFFEIHLTDICWPNNAYPCVDLSGALKIGRYNRTAYLNLSAHLRDLRSAHAMLTATVRPDQSTKIALNLKMPSLAPLSPLLPSSMQGACSLLLFANGSWDAFAALLFGGRATHALHGQLAASIQIDDFEGTSIAKKALTGPWSVKSSIEYTPEKNWRLFNLAANNDKLSTDGRLQFDSNGTIKESSLQFTVSDVRASGLAPIDGALTAILEMDQPHRAALTISSPQLKWDGIALTQATLTLQAEQLNDHWTGHLAMNAEAFGQKWTGSSDLLWREENSFRLDNLALDSHLGHFDGDLEIFPNRSLQGEIHSQITSLHDFNLPIYGALDAVMRWKIAEEKGQPLQSLEIDATGTDLFYKSLSVEKAFLYADLTGSWEHPAGHAYLEMQTAKWENMFLTTASIETSSAESNWPFQIHTNGDWTGPFNLDLDGFWIYRAPLLSLDLQDFSGSLFSRSIRLSSPISIEMGPDQLRIKDVEIAVGSANFKASVDHARDHTDAKLLLDHFPIDFLSLNPLNLSINGSIDLAAEMSATPASTTGSLNAKIIDATIESIGDATPIALQSHIAARLADNRLAFDADFQTRETPSVRLSGDLPMRFGIAPFAIDLPENKKITAALTFDGQIEELLDFFDFGPHRLEGTGRCDLHLSGDWLHPELSGFCRFENGRYENYYTGLQLKNISADIAGQGPSLILQTLTAQDAENKGSFSLTGDVKALSKEKFPFHIDGEFSRLNVAEIEWMRVEAGGNIHIVGDIDSASANAEVVILESDLSIPERIPHSLPDLSVKYINVQKPLAIEMMNRPRPKPYPIFLDFHISAPNGVFISGRGLSSEWKGDFQLGGTYTDIEAKGQLDLLLGEFLFSGHAFKLTQGALTFSGRPHEMPQLNVTARMDLQNLAILASLQGPLNAPQLAFQSIPSLPMGSILAHLLFGQNFSEINALQAAQLVNSIASFSEGGASALENTRRSLGVDRLRIIATPTSDEGGQSIALQVGKYVTRGILVSVSQGAEEGSTNLSVEVDLANGFIFQAESQQEQEQGKFTLKWNLNY